MTLLIEKPERPASNLAITGIYYFTHAGPLFAALDEMQRKNIRTKGEFQLTDAMELMVKKGESLTTFPVPAHTRTLVHRWRDRQRVPDLGVL